MKFKVLYEPKGKAKEYGDLALNLYKNCPHACVYCYVPQVLKTDRDDFHKGFSWRDKLREKLNKDLGLIEKQGKHIHLCFTCDPFPTGQYDTMLTLLAIQDIHDSGNFVQILTKGEIPEEVIEELCEDDIVGVTISCEDNLAAVIEPNALVPSRRLAQLIQIKQQVKCKTFVSCEPVFQDFVIHGLIRNANYIDEFKIGKLNYMAKDNPHYPKDINWREFGHICEELCKMHKRNYYIKDGLRKDMEGR